MRKVSYTGKFASKLYFIKVDSVVYGPYARKPTPEMIKGGSLVIFELNEEGNYIQQK
jgi:hypothetical protein